MNIQEIATRARVSTATASRAINGISMVDPRLARRARKVVDEFGYYPNTQPSCG
jgi:LacI family transcriptional regulator